MTFVIKLRGAKPECSDQQSVGNHVNLTPKIVSKLCHVLDS